MKLTFPLTLEFKFSLFTELRVTDASGALVALVKEKTFSVRDEVRVYSDETRRVQTHAMKAQGFMAGALDWKARRLISRADGSPVGALQAQGLRTLWGASYDLLGPEQEARFTIRDDQPWLSVVEGAIGVIPFIGDLIAMGFDYLVNPTYTVTDAGGQPAYRVHKKRSFLSRRFTVEELQPRSGQDDELVLLGLIQLVLRERERG
ncbi:hypothetical protein GCM10008959_29160 [Deinococcus seoulensis]|uniref:LURP-one-related family protein n=2 Tax=Deinococcus TaxID=1298 RepID=A0ABQ2RX03_9DEIO|nr:MULTISPECIES: hypothetical protein [Deinococcus]GGR65114.1 hypothetical protein GCM10008959_29160 [Deinococcus seoulensis]GGS38674.1 hypothetical protein GCM10008961_32690 [Deinococcus knuensis]